MDIEVGGFFGLIVLAFDVWAIVNVIASQAKTGRQVFWIIVILLLPIAGFVLWLLLGPRGRKSMQGSHQSR